MRASLCDLKHREIHTYSASDTFMYVFRQRSYSKEQRLEIPASQVSFSSKACTLAHVLHTWRWIRRFVLFACKYTFLSQHLKKIHFKPEVRKKTLIIIPEAAGKPLFWLGAFCLCRPELLAPCLLRNTSESVL